MQLKKGMLVRARRSTAKVRAGELGEVIDDQRDGVDWAHIRTPDGDICTLARNLEVIKDAPSQPWGNKETQPVSPAKWDTPGACPFPNGCVLEVDFGAGLGRGYFLAPHSYGLGDPQYRASSVQAEVENYGLRVGRVVQARPANADDRFKTVKARREASGGGWNMTTQRATVPEQYWPRAPAPFTTTNESSIKDPIVMSNSTYPEIKVETITYVNGVAVKDLSEAQIAAHFVALDKAIKDLEAIPAPIPIKLQKRIDRLKADRKSLVEILDSLEKDDGKAQ